MRHVCVFCGSQSGNRAAYAQAARDLGAQLARQQQTLVYGGGSVGLMGVIADAVLEAGGDCIGIIPQKLATRELLHPGVADMRCVPDMHSRKAQMGQMADVFIALPGGFGTLEELFEVVTWAQLDIHQKPVGLLNVAGYFDHLIQFLRHAMTEQFIHNKYKDLIVVSESPDDLLNQLSVLHDTQRRAGADSNTNTDLI